jgi:hypothetical protein
VSPIPKTTHLDESHLLRDASPLNPNSLRRNLRRFPGKPMQGATGPKENPQIAYHWLVEIAALVEGIREASCLYRKGAEGKIVAVPARSREAP